MKNFLGKRLVSLLLALVMVLGLLPAVAVPETEAATPDYATLKSTIQGFQYPMGSTAHWPVGNTDAVDGIYLLTSTLTRENTKGFTLCPSMQESNGSYVGYGTYRSEIIPNTSTNLIGASRDSYSILKGNATSFTIQTINQLYWNFESISTTEKVYGGLRLRSAVNGNQFYIGTSAGRYHIIRHKTNNWYLHSNSWTFRASIKFAPQGSTNGDENQFWICKVNEEAFYLRDALQDATTYLVSNSTGRFDAEAYKNFLTTVQAASDYYASIKRTVWSAINNSVTKSHKDAVYDAMARQAFRFYPVIYRYSH